MIIFTTLLLTVIVLAIISIIGIALTGAAGIVLFGDVIVCIWLIIKVMNLIRKKRRR